MTPPHQRGAIKYSFLIDNEQFGKLTVSPVELLRVQKS
jgi:hypothetical protein